MTVEFVPASQIEAGDVIAHPYSGTKYTVKAVEHRTDGTIEIEYAPSTHGALGVTVRSKRLMTRWR